MTVHETASCQFLKVLDQHTCREVHKLYQHPLGNHIVIIWDSACPPDQDDMNNYFSKYSQTDGKTILPVSVVFPIHPFFRVLPVPELL